MKLALCPACRRHTRAGEPCDHCGATERAPEPPSRIARLSRAAILASAAAVTTSAACAGSSSEPKAPASPTPTDEVSAAVYGGPPPELRDADAGPPPGLTLADAGEATMAIYGGPPPKGD